MSNNTNTELSAREHPAPPAPTAAQGDHQPVFAPHSNFVNQLPPVSDGSGAKNSSGAAPQPHGYNHTQLPQGEAHIHPELRSGHDSPTAAAHFAPIPNMIPQGAVVQHSTQSVPMSGPPAGVAPGVGPAGSEDGADGRKAKRELSQSKRAAQNRAAQRAFRQRKEGYIKKLEQQVRDFADMENNFKNLQNENYALRDYILRLQSRLLETRGEYPQPPPGINLSHPTPSGPQGHHSAVPEVPQHGLPAPPSVAGPSSASAPGPTPLEAAAQAVAGLTRSEHVSSARDHPYAQHHHQPPPPQPHQQQQQQQQPGRTDDDRTAEEITRQLQADGSSPDGLPPVPM
ncbi:putative transcription factor kapC [Dichotomopilus funicola]|uniref:Putative transcription factor kapC n=1 Tax=Dichotomopilus funicola TaxID=1934379 RepID=A0AAN6ZRV4_9PEZI|nr:putative transcription factor kapC [Dichotomopilus funicola]